MLAACRKVSLRIKQNTAPALNLRPPGCSERRGYRTTPNLCFPCIEVEGGRGRGERRRAGMRVRASESKRASEHFCRPGNILASIARVSPDCLVSPGHLIGTVIGISVPRGWGGKRGGRVLFADGRWLSVAICFCF